MTQETIPLKTLQLANETSAEWEATARHLHAALVAIENESCGDSDWTLERVHQALEAVWQTAREALGSRP